MTRTIKINGGAWQAVTWGHFSGCCRHMQGPQSLPQGTKLMLLVASSQRSLFPASHPYMSLQCWGPSRGESHPQSALGRGQGVVRGPRWLKGKGSQGSLASEISALLCMLGSCCHRALGDAGIPRGQAAGSAPPASLLAHSHTWWLPRLPYKEGAALACHSLVLWYLAFSGAHEACWVPGCVQAPPVSPLF